jgi:hypothetical protein
LDIRTGSAVVANMMAHVKELLDDLRGLINSIEIKFPVTKNFEATGSI